MATRRPARLAQNRHGVFCLRWIVPKRFRDAEGKPREVRVSLRTRDPQQARILAMQVNLAYERVSAMTSKFDPRQMLVPWTLSVGGVTMGINGEKDLEGFNSFLREHPEIKQAILKQLEQGVAPEQAATMLKELVRIQNDAAATAGLKAQLAPDESTQRPPAGVKPVKLVDALNAYCNSRQTHAGNRDTTVAEKRRTMGLLLEFLRKPDPEIDLTVDVTKILTHEVERDQFVDFIGYYTEQGAPKRRASEGAKGGRPTSSPKGLAARTVIKAVGHLKEFCTYAVAKKMMTINPIDDAFEESIDGIRKKAATARKHNNYKPFDANGLAKIFDPETHLRFNSAADYFWAPLLGLFTVARLGELVTRTIDDICVDPSSGLLVLRILEETGEDLKNENSERMVPIAQPLLDLGFARYVDHVRALGGTALFPHLKEVKTRDDDPSKNQSRQFSKYLKKIGLKRHDTVFHSFRHTSITVLHVRKVPMKDSELIAGHAA